MTHTIRIQDGAATFVYDDALADLLDTGTASVRRVSHVNFDNELVGWTADMSPVSGPVLGPFPTRQEALRAERDWLSVNVGL